MSDQSEEAREKFSKPSLVGPLGSFAVGFAGLVGFAPRRWHEKAGLRLRDRIVRPNTYGLEAQTGGWQ